MLYSYTLLHLMSDSPPLLPGMNTETLLPRQGTYPDKGPIYILVRSQKDIEAIYLMIEKHDTRDDVGEKLFTVTGGGRYLDHYFWCYCFKYIICRSSLRFWLDWS